MLIKYLIAEDGDDISHPNVFSIGNLQSPTLGDIRKLFPVPGRYHFRFLKNVGNMTVWMDAVDDALVVPPFDGRIFIKASRISDAPQRPPSDIPRQQQQSQQQHQLQQQQHQQSPSRNSPSPNTNSSRITIPKPPSSSETLLAFGSDDINEDDMQSASSNQMSGGSFMDSNNNDLIGLGSEPTMSHISKSTSNLDMFGIDSLQPTLIPMSTPPSMGGSYSSSPHQGQQDNNSVNRGMNNGMGGQPGQPLRGISPHPMPMPMMDVFSGLGSGQGNQQQQGQGQGRQMQQQQQQQGQQRRPY